MPALRILIVDDHEATRRSIALLLADHQDFSVCGEAADGLEAVGKTRELRPDVALMDISMPRMDGLEAARILRRDFPECGIVIVTQNDLSAARRQAAAVNANGFVRKSEIGETLLGTLDAFLAGRNAAASGKPDAQVSTHAELQTSGKSLDQLVQSFDWSKTPLGPLHLWPQSLKTIVRVVLTSRFAMWMGWGADLTFLYNDAYARMTLGEKHPWALGKPSREVWAEIWSDIGPRIRKVLDTGEATWDEALMLFLQRSGYREETYHTFSYSPLADDTGKVAGNLCVVTEVTDRVIGERRLETLRSLAAELNKAITEEDAVAVIARSLEANQQDLPLTLTYLFSDDSTQARLACSSGISAGHPAAPETITVAAQQVWPIGELLERKQSILVENFAERFPSVPTGAWNDPPSRALLVPIASQGQDNLAGFLVAALNPYRQLDLGYSGFIDLIAGQIAASIANARSFAHEKKRAEALAEIDRAKTAFFSNVSHEFRTPLTLMLGPLQDLLARSQTHLTPTAKAQIELANRNGARLLRLVNTLLDFSRIEAGRVQAVYQATDLGAFTAELASVFRSATERAGLRFVVDCRSLSEVAHVDRDMWEKIVLNLISNAFKFTFDGEINVRLVQTGSMAELRVRDTGVGISAEEIPRLFERFHRVPNTRSRTHEGSGIGLALVNELVKLHGGSMRAESQLGRGSTFIVSIPLGRGHFAANQLGGDRSLSSTASGARPFVEEALRWLPDAESPSDSSEILNDYEMMAVPSPPLSSDGTAPRPRVLIADDNADMRQYLARLLSERYEVYTVANGVAALEAIRKQKPHLVLSDVMMPEMDGFALLRELRADSETKTLPIILLSARAGEESRVDGFGAGADDYLVKPFSARELMARVQTHLELSRVRREAEMALREAQSMLESRVQQRTQELERAQANLRDLSGRLLQMQDEERRRIARELHDSAGQTLAALGMNLSMLANMADSKDPRVAARFAEMDEIVQQLTQEIRTTSYLLHPPLLDESGIAAALSWYIDGLTRRSNLSITQSIPEDLGRLPRDLELVVFRVVQECLTNIHRHSGSKSATITILRTNENLVVKVQDQGKGMSREELAGVQSVRSGVGIRGMRERVRQVGGSLTIDSNKSGTTVSVTLPVSANADMPAASFRTAR